VNGGAVAAPPFDTAERATPEGVAPSCTPEARRACERAGRKRSRREGEGDVVGERSVTSTHHRVDAYLSRKGVKATQLLTELVRYDGSGAGVGASVVKP
jgi:hypothetical protein